MWIFLSVNDGLFFFRLHLNRIISLFNCALSHKHTHWLALPLSLHPLVISGTIRCDDYEVERRRKRLLSIDLPTSSAPLTVRQ